MAAGSSKEAHGAPVEVTAAGRAVRVTSPDKVMFPGDEHQRPLTKRDVVNYYLLVEEAIMRTVADRPTLLQRFPNGAMGSNFFQKRIPDGAPDWLQTTTVSTPNGTTSRAIVMADIAHVVWAANLGCLGFHPWPYRAARPDQTDELRIDLDPSPGVTFPMVVEAAHEVQALFDELDVIGYIKTTGNRGLHVYVHVEPGWDSYAVRQAAVGAARMLAERRPDLITDRWWKEERGARVFVDFNQNAPHKTVFGAWCIRARPGAQVSAPFDWAELDQVDPDMLSVDRVVDRLVAYGDPWEPMPLTPSSIAPLVQRYADDLAAGIPDAPWPPVYPKMPDEAPRVQPSRARQP